MEYTVEEVIEALKTEGFTDKEFLRYAVPLLGYESKSLETNIPFTQDVVDKESPSIGVFQINVDTAAPQIFQYMARIGDEGVSILPRDSEHKRALAKGILSEEQEGRGDLLKVEGDAKDYAITFIQGLDLNQQAELFKMVYDQKEKEQEDKSFKNVLKKLYKWTTERMYEDDDEDAIAFLNNIIKDVDNYLAQPPVEIEEPVTPNYAGSNYEEDEGNTDLQGDEFRFVGTEVITPEATKEVWAKVLQKLYGVNNPFERESFDKNIQPEISVNWAKPYPIHVRFGNAFKSLGRNIRNNINDTIDAQLDFTENVYNKDKEE
jgi:hypothetical protein